MKLTKNAVKVSLKLLDRKSRRKILNTPFDSEKENVYDISYIDDNNELHKFDLYRAKGQVRNKTILDIHGGAYVRGSRKSQFYYAQIFKNDGYDFLVNDYEYVSKKKNITVEDQIFDCVKYLNYIDKHYEELNLSQEIFLMGDSAGGHFALFLAEMFNNETMALRFKFEVKNLILKGVILSCPVYDFEAASNVKTLTKKARKFLFGDLIVYDEWNKMLSPKEFLSCLNVPLFLTSCKLDFLKDHSMSLAEDLNKLEKKYTFFYLDTIDIRVQHVFNVCSLQLEESKKANHCILDFMSRY